MASKTGKVTIRGRFSPGTTVKLYSRGSADTYSEACGEPIDSAKTDKHGETTFSGPYGNYFAVAEEKVWNHIVGEHEASQRVVDVAIVDRSATAPALVGEEVGPEPPAQVDGGRIIIGARGSHALDPGTPTQIVDDATGQVQTFGSAVGLEGPGAPAGQAPRQEDAGDTPLASSTLTGEAIPPKQEAVKQEDAKGPQASDTPDGTATPVEVPKPKKKAKTSAPKKRAAKATTPAKKAAKKTQARKRR